MAKMLAVVASTLAAASVALAGCGGVDATGCSKVVKPGAGADANHAAIQDALSGAAPGDTICLAPGTYALHDELSLSVDNVTVRSTHDGMAVLDFAGQHENQPVQDWLSAMQRDLSHHQ